MNARAVGAGDGWIMRKHILPNCLEPLTVQLALAMSVGVFIEGAMSFLGLGITPPTPSLGSLIKEGTQNAYYSPFFVVGPLAAGLLTEAVSWRALFALQVAVGIGLVAAVWALASLIAG